MMNITCLYIDISNSEKYLTKQHQKKKTQRKTFFRYSEFHILYILTEFLIGKNNK